MNRIASVASYISVQKDFAQFGLIRLLADKTDWALDLLSKKEKCLFAFCTEDIGAAAQIFKLEGPDTT